jgi:CBS domain-containing protein
MLVKEVMTHSVITVDTNHSVFDACVLYKKYRIGSLIVLDGDDCAGILTERDIIERCICERKNPEDTLVSEVMTSDLKTIHALKTVDYAVELMKKYNIKKLPVLIKDDIVGIVTVTDIYKARPDLSKRFMDSWVRSEWKD